MIIGKCQVEIKDKVPAGIITIYAGPMPKSPDDPHEGEVLLAGQVSWNCVCGVATSKAVDFSGNLLFTKKRNHKVWRDIMFLNSRKKGKGSCGK